MRRRYAEGTYSNEVYTAIALERICHAIKPSYWRTRVAGRSTSKNDSETTLLKVSANSSEFEDARGAWIEYIRNRIWRPGSITIKGLIGATRLLIIVSGKRKRNDRRA